MAPPRLTRTATAIVLMAGLSLHSRAPQAAAQSPRSAATIPIVVAKASYLQMGPFETPTYLDGRTPPDWPATLLPPGAKVIGSSIMGDSALFRVRVVVFEFPADANPRDVIDTMLRLAGYGPPKGASAQAARGGFLQADQSPGTASGVGATQYCNGSTLAMFGAVDPAHTPLDFAVDLLDGEAGRQNCAPQSPSPSPHPFPVTIPPLLAPAGASQIGGASSSWSGTVGDMRTMLRTTMPADSILANYSAELIAAGWKAEGRAGIGDGVGVQRFTFHDGKDVWSGALFIMATGDHRDVRLEVSRVE